MDLTGKIALVTGAGQGVGRATALLFAQAGASVVVNDFHIDRAKAVADEIEAFGGVAMARQADITNLASVEAMTSEAIARFGRNDLLENNAGNAVIGRAHAGTPHTHDSLVCRRSHEKKKTQR